MKNRGCFIAILLLITGILFLTPIVFAEVQEIPSNQTFNFTISMNGYENYYAYSWQALETISLDRSEGSQTLIWEPISIGESIKIESSSNITISSSYAYTNKSSRGTKVTLGSFGNNNYLLYSFSGKEYDIKKIEIRAKSLFGTSEITPSIGRDNVLNKELLTSSISDVKNINEKEKINLGKVSDFNLNLEKKHEGEIANATYLISSDNPRIFLYFSDTNAAETDNEDAEIIAEFPEQVRTDVLVSSAIYMPTIYGLKINATIVNSGENNATFIRTNFFIDGELFESRLTPSLLNNESFVVETIYLDYLEVGFYNLTIITDYDNNTIDTNTSNNIFFTEFSLDQATPLTEENTEQLEAPFSGTKSFSGEIETELTKVDFSVDVTGDFSLGNTLKITAKSNMEGNDGDCVNSPYVEVVSPNGATKRVYIFKGMQCTKLKDKCLKYWKLRYWHGVYHYSPYSKDDYTICTYGTRRYSNIIRGLQFEQVKGKWLFPILSCARTKNPEVTNEFNITLSNQGEFKVKVGIEKAWDCSEEGYSYNSQEIGSFDVND